LILETINRDGEEFLVLEANGHRGEVLKAEGLTVAWNDQEKRFEYFDVDGQKVAHWLEKDKKVEITFLENDEGLRYIDFTKHLGLLVNWPAQKVQEAFDQQWNQDGQIRIPIPLDVRNGGIMNEGKVSRWFSLSFKELPKDTVVFSPFYAQLIIGAYGTSSGPVMNYTRFKNEGNEGFLEFCFPPFELVVAEGTIIRAGEPLIILSGEYFKSTSFSKDKDYQLTITDPRVDLEVNFENLTKDQFGRVVYLSK